MSSSSAPLEATAPVAAPTTPKQPTIWSVGGGKGGVGKSVISSSLALSMAIRGRRVALVDADLGGANLHTLLGLPAPARTLSDFIHKRVDELGDVMCPTSEPNLWLVSGARALMGSANPKHSQKQKVIRHLRNLPVDDVFLDLSAGSTYNVLDFFLAADRQLVVAIPEPTSVDNAYHFLKAAYLRSLSDAARRGQVRAVIEGVMEERCDGTMRTPRELLAAVAAMDPEAARLLRERAESFRPVLILNQLRSRDQRDVAAEMQAESKRALGAQVRVLATLERDESVRIAVGQKKPVVQLFPTCPFAHEVAALATRLLPPPPSPSESEPQARSENAEAGRLRALPRLETDDLLGESPSLEIDPPETPSDSASPPRPSRGKGGAPPRPSRTPVLRPGRPRPETEPAAAAEESGGSGANAASAAEAPAADGPSTQDTAQPSRAPSARSLVAARSGAQDPVGPGALLRRRREELSLGLVDLYYQTRIRCLEHIENERFDKLPDGPYVRGFVLQYAQALGLPEAEALTDLFVERYQAALA